MYNEPTNSNLPTPDELANPTRENMVKISLRVKESTDTFFKACAEKHGVKSSTLMNNLLDAYAHQYANMLGNGDRRLETIKQYLNRTANSIPKKAADTIIMSICQDGVPMGFYECADAEEAFLKYQKFVQSDEDNEEYATVVFELGQSPFEELICVPDNAEVSPEVESFEVGDNHYNHRFEIPASKWIIAAGVADRYVKKMHELYPERDTAISQSAFQKLAQMIYQAEKPQDVANNVVSVLIEDLEQISE